jgi:hypothetical protein
VIGKRLGRKGHFLNLDGRFGRVSVSESLENFALNVKYAQRVKTLVAKRQKSHRGIVRVKAAESSDGSDELGDMPVNGIHVLETMRRGLGQTAPLSVRNGQHKANVGRKEKGSLSTLSTDQLYSCAQRFETPGRSTMSAEAQVGALSRIEKQNVLGTLHAVKRTDATCPLQLRRRTPIGCRRQLIER